MQELQEADPQKFKPEHFENRIYTDAEIDYNIGLCELLNNGKQNAKKLLCKYESFEFLYGQLPSKQPIDLTPFPVNSRLCSIFP